MENWKVLFVEDNLIILEDMLSFADWGSAGYQTLSAINGRQGIRRAKTDLPAIVISDVELPQLDGLTMIEEILHENPYIKCDIISSFSDFYYARSALRLGVNNYFLKTELTGERLLEDVNLLRNEMKQTLNTMLTEIIDKLDMLLADKSGDVDIPALLDEILRPCMYFDSTLLLDNVSRYFMRRTGRRSEDKQTKRLLPTDVSELKRDILLLMEKKGSLQGSQNITQLSSVISNSVKYINEHYSNPSLKISEVASAVGLSSSRLSVKFKEEVGQTVNDFITDLRIERAKRLLSTGEYKVYEVAEKIGYKNSTYFSRVFFELTGHKSNGYSERAGDVQKE